MTLDELYAQLQIDGPKHTTSDILTIPVDGVMSEYERRDKFLHKYGFGVPDKEVIDRIIEFADRDTILEINSGLGLWSKLLHESGCKVIATDKKIGGDIIDIDEKVYLFKKGQSTYFTINRIEAVEAVKSIEANVLLTCWPCYAENYAYQALLEFKGNKVIYVGEGSGGCTADDAFHDLLEDRFARSGVIDNPTWWGLHDRTYFYKRKSDDKGRPLVIK